MTTNRKNKGGRPLKFKTVKDLEEKINAYFKSCWSQKIDMFGNPVFMKDKSGKKTTEPVMVQTKPYTVTGLAVFLDTSRETLMDYEGKKGFSDTIKKAKDIIYSYVEEYLFSGRNPTGAIFNLKNNWGWKDRKDITSGDKPIPILNAVHNNNSNKEADSITEED